MLSKHLVVDTVRAAKDSLDNLVSLLYSIAEKAESEIKGKEKLFGLILVALGANVYYWHKFSFWSKRGLKTPTPIPILGNTHTLFTKSRETLETEWSEKYGRVYGYYVGSTPSFACADLDVLNQVCIKGFSKFRNRSVFGVENRYERHLLFRLRDDEWHLIRSILSPTFSSGRMKIIFKLHDRCTDVLIDSYADKLKESSVVDPTELFRNFGISSSLSAFFSINPKDDDKKVLVEKSKGFGTFKLWRFILSFVVPKPLLRLVGFTTNPDHTLRYFDQATRKIIEDRKRSGKKCADYLQMLIDLEENQLVERDTGESLDKHYIDSDPALENRVAVNKSRIVLNHEQIVAQLMTFLLLGGETSNSVVTNTLYILAHQSEVQEKLYDELAKIRLSKSESDYNFDYDQLMSCVYLDCVVSESLRYMPLVVVLDRLAGEDFYVEKYDVTIPKGTMVTLCYYKIMRDPEYWPEPDKFDPDRFLPENKAKIRAGAFCPFGLGPRSCIAFRYALTLVKVSLARLILEYKFDPAPGTVFPPEPRKPGQFFDRNKKLVIAAPRNKFQGQPVKV